MPWTWNVPAASWTMVPAVTGVPSPQLIVARKSVTVPSGSASMKVATSTFVSGAPSVPLTATGLAVSGASAMVSVPVIVSGGRAGGVIGDGDADGCAAFLGEGVGAADGEVARAVPRRACPPWWCRRPS